MAIRRSFALVLGCVVLVLSLGLSTAATAAPRASRHAAHSLVVGHDNHHPKKHHKHKHHKPAPKPKPKPKPTKAARTTPTTAEVQAAIKGLKNYVHSLFSPSLSQVAELGNDVCTAYDKGQKTAQIEATMLAKVKKLPLTTVLPGAANYVVRTAVKLYCPGYQSKI